jgi:aspartate kinase
LLDVNASDTAGGRPEPSRIIVQKFGGTSVADAERIRRCAARIVSTVESGHQVVAVVSAMGSTTNELRDLAASISTRPHPRELDMLLSSGERISMALVAMAINELGHHAASYTGSQAGIITDALHTSARIADVRPRRIVEALERGTIPIIAGFQGVSEDTLDITTLGRGASDLTAIALAAALGADVCEIYTDVDGVYTADPRLCASARKLHAVSYEEMLEMASTGARVLQARSVELARGQKVLVHVRSSFEDTEGTYIREEDERMMEKAIISAVTHDASEAKLTLVAVPDRPGVAAKIFRTLADIGANVDMIVQNVSHDGRTDLSFTVPRDDLPKSKAALAELTADVEARGFESDEGIARVSLIGAGMKSHPGVAADMFDSLARAGVNIEMISTSPIRISCVIRETQVQDAVQAIHEQFHLSDEVVLRAEHPDKDG